MIKIGLLLAQFNEIEFIHDCLTPWMDYRRENPENLEIACLDVKFLENDSKETRSTDGSYEYLSNCYEKDYIDYFLNPVGNFKEHEARNFGLEYLLKQGITHLLSFGSDELIKPEQIPIIFNYLKKEPFPTWFKIHYKNYVGDKKHYVLGFQPPRIFKTSINGFKLKEYFWDDDVSYEDLKYGNKVSYKDFPSKLIPNLLIDHMSWLDGERSVKKIKYQHFHFGHCGYKYNDKGEVSFDESYYKKFQQSIPEILSEE